MNKPVLTMRLGALAFALATACVPAMAAKPEGAGGGQGKHEAKHQGKHDGKHAGNLDRRDDRAAGRMDSDDGKSAKRADKAEARRLRAEDVRPGGFFNDADREAARRYYGERHGEGKKCPPGLAKKDNGCLPPGQAKKLEVGQSLPNGVRTYSVPQTVISRLPPAPVGSRYVRVGDDIVLVSSRTQTVVDVIAGLFR